MEIGPTWDHRGAAPRTRLPGGPAGEQRGRQTGAIYALECPHESWLRARVMGGLSLSIAEFDEVVLRASTPVVVMFLAKWCGPSQQLSPIIDEIAAESNGKIKVIKVDIDDNPFITAKYGIRGCPTLILFRDGCRIRLRLVRCPSRSCWIGWNRLVCRAVEIVSVP